MLLRLGKTEEEQGGHLAEPIQLIRSHAHQKTESMMRFNTHERKEKEYERLNYLGSDDIRLT